MRGEGSMATLRGGWDIPGGGGVRPRNPQGIHHSAWANRPISPDGPQDQRPRADRQNVESAAAPVRVTGGRRSVTRKLVALLAGGLLVLALTGCMSTEESSVFLRINDLRAQSGQPALLPDGELVAKAQAHSQEMAASGTLFHTTLRDGITGSPRKMGENVAYAGSIEQAFQALLNSPPHLANMVDGAFNRVGVGIFTGSDGRVWVTMVFATR